MTLVKCPRCELNYMNENEKMCSVCRKELRGDTEQSDVIELCSECGENPVVSGQELCIYCLKEFMRRNANDDTSDDSTPEKPATELDAIDSVSTMDEIELDLEGDLDDESFDEDDLEDEARDDAEDLVEDLADDDDIDADEE